MPEIDANYDLGANGLPQRNDQVQLRTLNDLDGRTRAARLAQGLIAELMTDLGGEAKLTAAQKELIVRTAMLSVITGDAEARWLERRPVDLVAYGTLTDRLRRLIESLGLNTGRKKFAPRDVTHEVVARLRAGASI